MDKIIQVYFEEDAQQPTFVTESRRVLRPYRHHGTISWVENKFAESENQKLKQNTLAKLFKKMFKKEKKT